MRESGEIDGCISLSGDEGKEGKTDGRHEPEEANVGGGDAAVELAFEESLLVVGETVPVRLTTATSEADEADKGRHSHCSERQAYPKCLALPLNICVVDCWLASVHHGCGHHCRPLLQLGSARQGQRRHQAALQ